jgi:hypothetical protein
MLNLWAASFYEVPAASLEDDDVLLCELAMCDPVRWSAVRDVVLRGWVRCADKRLYHPVVAERALETWKGRKGYRDRLAIARAARKAKSAEKADSDSMIEAVIEPVIGPVIDLKVQGISCKVQDSKKEKEDSPPKPPKREVRGTDMDPDFCRFWDIYPRKDGKGAARAAWRAALKKADPETIITGCVAYQFNLDRKYIPHPSTWLNGERWLQAKEDDHFDPVLRAAGLIPEDFALDGENAHEWKLLQ